MKLFEDLLYLNLSMDEKPGGPIIFSILCLGENCSLICRAAAYIVCTIYHSLHPCFPNLRGQLDHSTVYPYDTIH